MCHFRFVVRICLPEIFGRDTVPATFHNIGDKKVDKTKRYANKIRSKKRGGKPDLYYQTMKHFPQFIRYLAEDILRIESYTENEIGFGSGVSLESVRKIINGKTNHVNRKMFQEMIHFYSRTVCGWCSFRYRAYDFEFFSDD